MIIYNVTLKVEHEIADEWLQWMKTSHIPDLMKLGLFHDYKLCRLLEQDETEGLSFVAQYFCESLEQYHRYLADFAPAMREQMYQKFGAKVIAFRTVMQVEHQSRQ